MCSIILCGKFFFMSEQENYPPKLQKTATGDIDINSLANLLEWFLNFDRRVGLVRHPHVEELFQWKQKDDAANGIEVYPFENAESRFAVGAFQALGENQTRRQAANVDNRSFAGIRRSEANQRGNR